NDGIPWQSCYQSQSNTASPSSPATANVSVSGATATAWTFPSPKSYRTRSAPVSGSYTSTPPGFPPATTVRPSADVATAATARKPVFNFRGFARFVASTKYSALFTPTTAIGDPGRNATAAAHWDWRGYATSGSDSRGVA